MLLITALALAAFVFGNHIGLHERRVRDLRVGVDLSSGFYDPESVAQFSALIGRRVSIVQNFVSWEYIRDPGASNFPTSQADQILAEGAEPEVTWDPTIAGASVAQPGLSLDDIVGGRFDSYIRAFALAAKALGRPILIRFAHEMNGPWTSYYVNHSGNRPGDFVRAWRHVFHIFRSVGADNVQWVWSPNAVSPGDSSLAQLYPGDQYVNWVGIDGYSYPSAGCRTASQIFDPALDEIARFSGRPEMLSEVGISAQCANKAALMRGLFGWLGSRRRIRAIVWWQRDQTGENWEIQSDAASLDAFRAGIGDGR